MKINGEIKSKSIIAAFFGFFLTILIVSSVFILPNYLDIFNPNNNTPNPPPVTQLTIGARIAKYLETRSSEIVFGFSYNNTFVNTNLSEILSEFVDGFIIYGAPMNGSTINLTIIHISGATNININTTEFISVTDSLETAMYNLNTTSSIEILYDLFPPTFMWDIAFNDKSSLSLVYSHEKKVIAAVNGTWEMSSFGFGDPPIFIDFPNFEYEWEEYENRKFLALDDDSEALVELAIQAFYEMITNALGNEG